MPEESKTNLHFNRHLSLEEYERLSWGLIPQEMEDKWFIYLEANWLYFHRSWTGYCVFQLRLERIGDSYNVVETWVDRQQLWWNKNQEDERTIELLDRLIDRFCEEDK